MKWNALEEEPCSVARTVAVIGDRWTLLILRECFLRKRRFEAFGASLGITRHVLADRLKKLVRFGVLRRSRIRSHPSATNTSSPRRVSTSIRLSSRSIGAISTWWTRADGELRPYV